MRDLVYFDLETQRTANDAGGWDRKGNMQMSIGVTYSDADCPLRNFSRIARPRSDRAPAPGRSRGWI